MKLRLARCNCRRRHRYIGVSGLYGPSVKSDPVSRCQVVLFHDDGGNSYETVGSSTVPKTLIFTVMEVLTWQRVREILDKNKLLRFPVAQSSGPEKRSLNPRTIQRHPRRRNAMPHIPSYIHAVSNVYSNAWPMNMLSLTSETTSLLSSLPTMTMPLPPRVPFLPTLPSRWMKSMVVCGTS